MSPITPGDAANVVGNAMTNSGLVADAFARVQYEDSPAGAQLALKDARRLVAAAERAVAFATALSISQGHGELHAEQAAVARMKYKTGKAGEVKYTGKQTGQPTYFQGDRAAANVERLKGDPVHAAIGKTYEECRVRVPFCAECLDAPLPSGRTNCGPACRRVGRAQDQQALFHHESGATRSHLARRYDLIPTFLLERVAQRHKLGADKHGAWNWERGFPWEDTFNHIIEHLYKWRDEVRKWQAELARETGNDVPPLSEDHLAAVALGAEFLMLWERQRGVEVNQDKC